MDWTLLHFALKYCDTIKCNQSISFTVYWRTIWSPCFEFWIEKKIHSLLHFVESVDAAGERELFELAQKMVRLRVDLQTWQAFERTAILGESGTDVSKQLQMPIASVYQAKSRVQKLLKDQVDQLDRGVA